MPATQELLHQGRYRVGQPLDSTVETVFNAYDTVSNVNVVVKEIPVAQKKVTTLSQQENSKVAFTNHAQAIKNLRHDSLLNVEDYFCEVGRQFLVLEAFEGRSLEALCNSMTDPVEMKQVSRWADQILDALVYLASIRGGAVHGRINPRNIFLSEDGRVKLLAVGSGDAEMSVDTSLSTDDPSAYINYSALEQLWDGLDPASKKVIANSYDERSEAVLNEPPDGRSDVYSLGAVMYQLVTGVKPVDPLERSIEILDANPDPLKPPVELNKSIPQETSDLIMRALEIRRERRFDNAAVMRQALRTLNAKLADDTDEDLEMAEAAKELKYAVSNRKSDVDKLLEEKKRELEAEQERQRAKLDAEQERQRAELEAKLRELEEQRILAEKRAAEAERLLLEKERLAAELTERAESAPKPSAVAQRIHESAEPVATARGGRQIPTARPESDPVEVMEMAEPEIAEPEIDEADVEEVVEAVVVETVAERPDVVDAEAIHVSETDAVLSYGAEPARSMPVAAIAGGLFALILVGVGVWFFALRSAPAPSPTAQQPVIEQPAAPAPETVAPVQAEAPVDTFAASPQENAASPENAVTDTASKTSPASSAPVAKPKKPAPEPAKAKAETPKKVTVDDLINDN